MRVPGAALHGALARRAWSTRHPRRRPLPPKAVALTFDDGYLDNYTQAFPILRRHGLTATFYVTTNCIDNRALLWTGLLRFVIFTTTRPRARDAGAARVPPAAGQRPGASRGLHQADRDDEEHPDRATASRCSRRCGDAAAIDDLSPLESIMMSWDQVREMHRGGMIFGAHTLTHPNLPNATPEEARREIVGSRDALAAAARRPRARTSRIRTAAAART